MLRHNTLFTANEIEYIYENLPSYYNNDLPRDDEEIQIHNQMIASCLRQKITASKMNEFDFQLLLGAAAISGAIDILKQLKERNHALVNEVINRRDERGLTPLALAVVMEQVEAIDFFLDETNADINWCPMNNSTGNLLELAISHEAVKSLAHLTKRFPAFYVSCNQPIENKRTPFPLIVMANTAHSMKALTWLLTEGPDKGLRGEDDPSGYIVGIAASGRKMKGLEKMAEIAPQLFYCTQHPSSPNEKTLIINSIITEQHEMIVFFLKNNFVANSEMEIKLVVFYFSWYFKNLTSEHNKGLDFHIGEAFSTNQEKFDDYFNLLLKYAGNCISVKCEKPEMLHKLERLAGDYAALKSAEVQSTLNNIPKSFWIKIIAQRVNMTVDENYPAKYPIDLLEMYLSSQANREWHDFVFKITGVDVGIAETAEASSSTSLIFSNLRRNVADENKEFLAPSEMEIFVAELTKLTRDRSNGDLPVGVITSILGRYSAMPKIEQVSVAQESISQAVEGGVVPTSGVTAFRKN